MVRCKTAGVRRVSRFYLYCGVLNAKLIMEFTTNTAEQTILTHCVWHHEMGRECGFGGTHPPDVEVMHIGYVWQRT